jgi:GAF domain-containing protein
MMQGNIAELKPKPGTSCELDFLHRIAEHVAKGDTFDETLASAIDFAVWLVSCDHCVAYVREQEELVPWVWKYSGDGSIERSRLSMDHVFVRALSQHLQPIAVSQSAGADFQVVDFQARDFQVKDFSAWSGESGEASVWIPLVARGEMLGAIQLEHRQPHRYDRREINLLSSMARILAADIRISRLKSNNSELLLELETRKLVERGKGILQRDLGLNEKDAYLVIERRSRQKRRPMKEVAEAIILSDELKRSSLATE